MGAFFNNPKRPLAANIAHAIFFDQTHDNQSFAEKRSVFDQLPSTAMISMACCATGSNRGFDELVPHHIHVVNEERQYQAWGKQVHEGTGIIAGKKILNELHGFMGLQGFNQVFVDQMNPDIVGITRQNPITHESFILVAHTAFGYPDPHAGLTNVRPLIFEGKLEEIYCEMEIRNKKGSHYARHSEFKKDPSYINGLDEYEVTIKKNIQLRDSNIFNKHATILGETTQLNFVNLKPGSVVVVRVSPHAAVTERLRKLHVIIDDFELEKGGKYQEVQDIISKLNLVDLNLALFGCDQEERDRGYGYDAYDIPGFKRMEYAGLQGVLSLLSDISPNNDLGHPLCNNLRQGNWLIGKLNLGKFRAAI